MGMDESSVNGNKRVWIWMVAGVAAVALIVGILALGRRVQEARRMQKLFGERAAAVGMAFDEDRVRVTMSTQTFKSLAYWDRAVHIANQVDWIVEYARHRLNMPQADAFDIFPRIEQTGDTEFTIRRDVDPRLLTRLARNRDFASGLKPTDRKAAGAERLVNFIKDLEPTGTDHPTIEQVREKMFGFQPDEMREPHLTQRAKDYIHTAFVYRDIARVAVADANLNDPDAVLNRLLNWTFLHVDKSAERALPGIGSNDYDDNPLSVIVRGMGGCDRAAWSLATIAWHLGLSSHVVYLYRDPALSSSHTICEIKISGSWRACDAYNNVHYPLPVAKLSQQGAYFQHARIFVNVPEAEALLPVMALAERFARIHVPGQRLFYDSLESVDEFARDNFQSGVPQDLFDNIAKSFAVAVDPYPVNVSRWDYPFWIRGYYTQDLMTKLKFRALPYHPQLQIARTLQLLGYHPQAEQRYLELSRMPAPEYFNEEIEYFRIFNAYERGQPAAVIGAARGYQARFPQSPRNKILAYITARSLEQIGRTSELARAIDARTGLRAARQVTEPVNSASRVASDE